MDEYNEIKLDGLLKDSSLAIHILQTEEELEIEYSAGGTTNTSKIHFLEEDREYNAIMTKKIFQNLVTLNIITYDDLIKYYDIASTERLEENFYLNKQDFDLNDFAQIVNEEKQLVEKQDIKRLVSFYDDEIGLPGQLVNTVSDFMSLSSGEQLLVDLLREENYKELYEANNGILGEEFAGSALDIINYRDNEELKKELKELDDINQNYLDNPLNLDDVFEGIKEGGGISVFLSDLIINYDKYEADGSNYSKEGTIDLAVRYSLDKKLDQYFEQFNNTASNIYYDNLGGVYHERDLVEVIPDNISEELNTLGYEDFMKKHYHEFEFIFNISDNEYLINYKVFNGDNIEAEQVVKDTQNMIEEFTKEYGLEKITETNAETLLIDMKLNDVHFEMTQNNEIKNFDKQVDNLYLTPYNEVDGVYNLEIDINGIPTEWEMTVDTPKETIKEYVQEHVEISDHLLIYDRVIENVEDKLGVDYVEAFELVDGLINSSGKQQELINYMMDLNETNQDYVETIAEELDVTESDIYEIALDDNNKDLYFAEDLDLLISTGYLVKYNTVKLALEQHLTEESLEDVKQASLGKYEVWHEVELEGQTFEEYLGISNIEESELDKYNQLPDSVKKVIDQSYNLKYNLENNLGLGSGQEQLLDFATQSGRTFTKYDISNLDKRNSAIAYLIAEEKGIYPVNTNERNSVDYQLKLDLLDYVVEFSDTLNTEDLDIETEFISAYVLQNNLKEYIDFNEEIKKRDFITHLQETDGNHNELRESLLNYYNKVDIEELTQEIMERYGQMAVEDSLNELGFKEYPDIFNKSNDLFDAIQSGDNFEVEEDKYLQAVMGEEGFNAIKEIVKSNNMVSLSDFEEYQNYSESINKGKYNLLEEQAWNTIFQNIEKLDTPLIAKQGEGCIYRKGQDGLPVYSTELKEFVENVVNQPDIVEYNDLCNWMSIDPVEFTNESKKVDYVMDKVHDKPIEALYIDFSELPLNKEFEYKEITQENVKDLFNEIDTSLTIEKTTDPEMLGYFKVFIRDNGEGRRYDLEINDYEETAKLKKDIVSKLGVSLNDINTTLIDTNNPIIKSDFRLKEVSEELKNWEGMQLTRDNIEDFLKDYDNSNNPKVDLEFIQNPRTKLSFEGSEDKQKLTTITNANLEMHWEQSYVKSEIIENMLENHPDFKQEVMEVVKEEPELAKETIKDGHLYKYDLYEDVQAEVEALNKSKTENYAPTIIKITSNELDIDIDLDNKFLTSEKVKDTIDFIESKKNIMTDKETAIIKIGSNDTEKRFDIEKSTSLEFSELSKTLYDYSANDKEVYSRKEYEDIVEQYNTLIDNPDNEITIDSIIHDKKQLVAIEDEIKELQERKTTPTENKKVSLVETNIEVSRQENNQNQQNSLSR